MKSSSTDGMNAPRSTSHSGVRINASAHQTRQRSSVRKGTCSPLANFGAPEFEPACRLELRTITIAKYTRRPRKRTELGVVRVRHESQQKLNRNPKLDANSGKQPRGLR